MICPENNYAFIDSQNLNLGIQKLGWKLDYKKFRIYLKEKYAVQKAYMFLGYVASNQSLYTKLTESGFILKFKPISLDERGKIKGNIDADLVLQAMIDFDLYNNAVLVSSDGDFYSLVNYLRITNKLKIVLAPDRKNCARLIKECALSKIWYMENIRAKLEYFSLKTKKSTP